MKKTKRLFAVCTATLFLHLSGLAHEATQLDYPEEILNQAREYEDWYVSGEDSYGVGVILMGQLVLADGGDATLCAFRDNISKGGYFATYLYPGRTMTFWQHGYKPVVLEYPHLYPPRKKGIIDVGKVMMYPSEMNESGSVTGHVHLANPEEGPATVELWVRMPPTHLDDDAHLGGCRVSYRVKSQQVADGESFSFKDLSPIGYELQYSAPGHIREVRKFDHGEKEAVMVNEVSLAASNMLSFVTISPLKHFDSRDLADKVNRTVEANGRDRLVFTNLRDELGNTHNFRFRNKGDQIIISYWRHPWYFIDLGKIPLERALMEAKKYKDYKEEELKAVGTIYTPLKSGHTYYFSCPENQINCLFSVSF